MKSVPANGPFPSSTYLHATSMYRPSFRFNHQLHLPTSLPLNKTSHLAASFSDLLLSNRILVRHVPLFVHADFLPCQNPTSLHEPLLIQPPPEINSWFPPFSPKHSTPITAATSTFFDASHPHPMFPVSFLYRIALPFLLPHPILLLHHTRFPCRFPFVCFQRDTSGTPPGPRSAAGAAAGDGI